MLVLAAIPRAQFVKLRSASSERYTFVPTASWAEAFETIRLRPVEIAVVDPLLGGQPRTHEIERLRVLFPSLPLLVYTTLTPNMPGVLLELGRLGIRHAIFARLDDHPTALRSILRRETDHTASQQVFQGLAGMLDGLPSRLRWALEATLHAPSNTPRVSVLAERAKLRPRTCERWFARSGLPSPKIVLVLARLLYAHRLLLDPGYTVEDVAFKLGYRKVKSLQMHLKEVFGLTAGELRISLSVEDAVAIVRARYFPSLQRVAS